MKILQFKSNTELNEAAALHIIQKLKGLKDPIISAATGNSSTGIYQKLIEKKYQIDTKSLRFITLDEWSGLDENDKGSCKYYLKEHLIDPLNIHSENFISFDGKSENSKAECERIQSFISSNGPIDLCILGLGLNGHIAFNDPADNLKPHVHYTILSSTSLAHPMIEGSEQELKYGYTLGMADILQSKTILLVINGRHKKQIYEELMKVKITTQLPGSFLWLHQDAYCYYCED